MLHPAPSDSEGIKAKQNQSDNPWCNKIDECIGDPDSDPEAPIV